MLSAVAALHAQGVEEPNLAAVSSVGRAAGLEPLDVGADAHAAGGLYERHSPRVFRYCLSRLGRREDAEDAVQTTFLHAVRGVRSGVVPTVELAWLLGIARNVCLSRAESTGRRGRLELVCDPVDLERSAAPQGRRDELIGLESALSRLPEQQRQAVLLRDWRGLSYSEVAAQLGVSLANAESLIFRGRRTLAELLDETPGTVRRRLGALGHAGSLVTAVKSALGGAAAATKIAAAVTAVAVSAGIAAGTAMLGSGNREPAMLGSGDREPGPAGVPARAAVTPAARAEVRTSAPPRAPLAVPAQPNATPARSTPVESVGATTAAGPPAAPTAPTPTGAAPTQAESKPPAGAAPVPSVKVPRIEDPVPTTPTTVQSAVDDLVPVPAPTLPEAIGSLPVPQLPVATPPLVEAVVESVPPVTVTPPATPPIEPVAIDPSTLLP